MTETKVTTVVPKRNPVRALHLGQSETAMAEAVRWLTKWDIEASYQNVGGSDERWTVGIVTSPTGGFRMAYPGDWILFYPRTGKWEILTEREFGGKYEETDG